MLDFSVRVSSREAYVSPTRGAQGNALKTILAMPFVLDGRHGRIEIEARGVRHALDVHVDYIEQKPVIGHIQEPSDVKTGTIVRVLWPDLASSILANAEWSFYKIVEGVGWLNPHLTLTLDWFGERIEWAATVETWAKWKPSDPTSPPFNYPHLGSGIASFAPRAMSVSRERPRQMTVFPGGGSRVRAR